MQFSENIWCNQNLIKTLKKNGVVIMPTDTMYGIVGRAENISTVERIYKIRKRSPKKPCIVLIGDINELEKFGINISDIHNFNLCVQAKSDPVSVILYCPNESFAYIHRGTRNIAFRLPSSKSLQDLLMTTGPLIAPSANIEGQPPAQNIREARSYFGDKVDLYIDGGDVSGKASKVIRLQSDGSISILRE